ncbi:MAG: leucine-rich repeat domain-containing protein [Bacteroidaceae bacterium]|nr:leucine-rich repeat domain-containing protein [Bacteroidaceae bacterium]
MKTIKHLFIALLLLSATGVTAHDFEVDGIYYNIIDAETVEVTYRGDYYNEYSNEYAGSVTIPQSVKYEGITYSIKSIGYAAFGDCSGLTSIEIPNSVTSIGEWAFYDCSGLTSVVIGNSVTSIGYEAFYGCTRLKTIINLSNLTFSKGSSDHGYVARNANKIINAPNGLIDGDFIWFEKENKMTFAGYLGNSTELTLPAEYNGKSVTSIGVEAFYKCSGLTSVVIPNSVTSIGSSAFNGCAGLTCVEIPNSVTSIGYDAFGGCTGLTSVTIGNSVTSIDDYAFYNCSGLTSVEIPNSVTSIGDDAFYGCSGLTSIVIPNSVTSIGNYAFFYCTGLKTVINFSNLTFSKGSSNNGYIAYYAEKVYNAPNGSIEGEFIFGKLIGVNTLVGYLGNSTELTLPAEYNGKSVTSIGVEAFYKCSGLTSVVIPNSVTSIGDGAFYGCSGLTNVVIGNGVTSIGDWAFYGCTNIENLYISNSLERIGEKAFAGCKKIKEIKIGLEKPIRGAANIFADAVYDNAVLYVPTGTKSLYEKREPWNLFFDIVEINFTGIDEVVDEMKGENGEVKTIYDLQGREVTIPTTGIYIINGKKVLVK